MNRLRALSLGLLTACALLVGTPERAAAEPEVLHVAGATVNLRAAASTAADKRATARRGERLTVITRDGEWVQVQTAAGVTAWIHGDYVSATPPAAAPAKPRGPSDAELRKRLIAASIDAYPGNCPCPYHTDRAGRSCGRRSAYSRPGGHAPLCYPRDVSDEMVEQERARLRE